jgi:hypothetical protein
LGGGVTVRCLLQRGRSFGAGVTMRCLLQKGSYFEADVTVRYLFITKGTLLWSKYLFEVGITKGKLLWSKKHGYKLKQIIWFNLRWCHQRFQLRRSYRFVEQVSFFCI